nr:NusG domain II-containing protein [uncultured Treponema sp.]
MNRLIFRIFRPFDFVIFTLFALLTAASFLFLKTSRNSERRVVINAGKKEFIFPLDKNREIEIEGNIGKSLIIIKDGRAFFKTSPCQNKTCIQMGAVIEENDWAACLPNDVFIRVE